MTVFPYRSAGVASSLEWLTSVAQSHTTEQRRQLRAQPRLALEQSFEMSGDRFRKAQALLELSDGELTIPDWRYEQPIAAGFSSASLVVAVDATYFTPEVGDAVLVWQDEDNFTETTVAAYTSGSLTLANGPTVAYGAASVLPALEGVATSQLSTSQSRPTFGTADLGVAVTEYKDLSSWFSGDEHGGLFVAPRDVLSQSQTGGVSIARTNVDFGLGPIQPVRVRTENVWLYSLQFSANTKAELLAAEATLHKLAGRLTPFWRPTWLPDFTLQADAVSGQTYIRVEIVANGTDIPALAIERVDGTTEFFEVTSLSSTGSYTQINLDGALAAALAVSDVRTVSTMRLSRLDTDVVGFSFDAAGNSAARATTVGIAE